MEKNSAQILHELYFKLTNRKALFQLKNGNSITGIIIGFFYDDEEGEQKNICKWHIVDENDAQSMGVNLYGYLLGTIIFHNELASVFFFENNQTIYL